MMECVKKSNSLLNDVKEEKEEDPGIKEAKERAERRGKDQIRC